MIEDKQEKAELALETLHSKGWKEVILPEIIEACKQVLSDLENTNNSRETDLIIKGQLLTFRDHIDLEKKYENMLKEK